MGDEDELVDLDVIDAAIEAIDRLGPGDEDRLVSLLKTVEGAMKELVRLQEQLSEIIERQVERRAHLIDAKG